MDHIALSLRNRKGSKLAFNSSPIILLSIVSLVFGFWLGMAIAFLIGL